MRPSIRAISAPAIAARLSNVAGLCSTQLDDQAELDAPGEREAVLAFCLRFRERIADRQKIRDQLIPAVRSKGQVADAVRRVERAPYELTAAADVAHPRHDGAT